MSSSPTFADVMAAKSNTRRRSTYRVCLNAEVEEAYAALTVELEDAVRAEAAASDDAPKTGRAIGETPASKRIAEQIAELIGANPTAFYELRLQAMRAADWRSLVREHAPRDDSGDDLWNAETFPEAALRASLIDPEPSDEAIGYLVDTLTDGELTSLGYAVWMLNSGVRETPKAPAPV